MSQLAQCLGYTYRMRLSARSVAFLILFSFFLLGVFVQLPLSKVFSAGTTPLSGYAWSDNVGWISVAGSNYGLTINADNTVTGYAWGDNVGWINFNATSCGAVPTLDPVTKALSGWAKALNGVGSDGCISLSGANYGVKIDGTHSYAWASDTLGWVDFYYVLIAGAAPTCSVTYTPTTFIIGQPYAVDWASTDATSRSYTLSNSQGQVIAGPYSVAVSGHAEGVSFTDLPVGTYTRNDSVTGFGGSGACAQTLVVANQATPAASGCLSVGSSSCSPPKKTARVTRGASTSVYWNVSNVTSCTVTANGTQIGTGLTNTVSYQPTNKTDIILTCTGNGGFADQAVINITPIFIEI